MTVRKRHNHKRQLQKKKRKLLQMWIFFITFLANRKYFFFVFKMTKQDENNVSKTKRMFLSGKLIHKLYKFWYVSLFIFSVLKTKRRTNLLKKHRNIYDLGRFHLRNEQIFSFEQEQIMFQLMDDKNQKLWSSDCTTWHRSENKPIQYR